MSIRMKMKRGIDGGIERGGDLKRGGEGIKKGRVDAVEEASAGRGVVGALIALREGRRKKEKRYGAIKRE
jgi:hypothetical protein